MSRRQNPPMPATAFGLLLVEGGDELAACRIVAEQAWNGLCGWKADGRDLPNLARLARNDPNFRFARSVGVVLDIENDWLLPRTWRTIRWQPWARRVPQCTVF